MRMTGNAHLNAVVDFLADTVRPKQLVVVINRFNGLTLWSRSPLGLIGALKLRLAVLVGRFLWRGLVGFSVVKTKQSHMVRLWMHQAHEHV